VAAGGFIPDAEADPDDDDFKEPSAKRARVGADSVDFHLPGKEISKAVLGIRA
jgi:hypothetical protein